MQKLKLIEAFIVGLLLGAAITIVWFIVFVFVAFLVLGSRAGSPLFPLFLLGVPLLTFIYFGNPKVPKGSCLSVSFQGLSSFFCCLSA